MAPLFITHETHDRGEVFDRFRTASPPAVLVSPSAYYGEDFPDDQARWQIVAKIPYPYKGDPWIKAKMKLDAGWYKRETMGALVQMVARITRGPEDYGRTYILDSNFERLFPEAEQMFPPWFKEALIWPSVTD